MSGGGILSGMNEKPNFDKGWNKYGGLDTWSVKAVKKSRAESDAELVKGGADVDEAGSLNPTAEQKIALHDDATNYELSRNSVDEYKKRMIEKETFIPFSLENIEQLKKQEQSILEALEEVRAKIQTRTNMVRRAQKNFKSEIKFNTEVMLEQATEAREANQRYLDTLNQYLEGEQVDK